MTLRIARYFLLRDKSKLIVLKESPCLKQCRLSCFGAPTQDSTTKRSCQSSSPVGAEMPFISSPVSYPPSSSPPAIPENRKRNRPNDQAHPSKKRLLGSENVQSISTEEAHGDVDGPPNDRLFPAKFQPRVASIQKGPFLDDDEGSNTVEDSSMLAVFQSAIGKAPRQPSPDLPAVQAECDPQKTCSTRLLQARTCSGRAFSIEKKISQPSITYKQLIASRSTTVSGRATKSFYGVDIHDLLDQATKENKQLLSTHERDTRTLQPSIEEPTVGKTNRKGRTMMWTEKYRARKFTDLVGDERTHRDVLRWIKGWDPIVFPGTSRPKPKSKYQDGAVEDRPHRKILLLAGPPGLGKTTLAHVCARQAGYEVVEINASDERSKDVVKGRIRDIVGTENVKGINTKDASGTVRKAGRPVCVVVDEVDGVVSGSGSGEGGFIKALIDLAMLDQKNPTALGTTSSNISRIKNSKKGDRFRLLRPIILICNDVYHPALRPLRSSVMAEIIHIRRPPLDKVVTRLKTVFDKEGVACDSDGVRRLCEAAWGISNKRESRPNSCNTGEGDIRGVLVIGEWVAAKLRANAISSSSMQARLTRRWVEQNMLENLSHGGGAARGLGRGGAKEAVERIFVEGAGFPKPITPATEKLFQIASGKSLGVAELGKRHAMERLREIVDTSGDTDRIMTDCFAVYPSQPFQDDTYLSKPNAAYDSLHFHDCLSSKVYSGQEWELSSYLSQPILSFHHLFASPNKHLWRNDQKGWDDDNEEGPIPFSGPRADYMAFEAQKQTKAILLGLQLSLSIPLLRSFRSPEDIASGLVPYLNTILSPNVKPVIVGGSGEQRGIVSVRKEGERRMVERAVGVMSGVGVTFERGRTEAGPSGVSTFVYRMEP